MMWTAEIQIYVKIWSSQWYLQIKQLQSYPKKKNWGLQRDLNPWPLRSGCSALTNWTIKPQTLGAGQFVDFMLTRETNETRNDDVNCESTNLCEDMIVAVVLAIYNKQFSAK